ncbi:hypothetical protein FB451DRAFT_1173414 [Mycena latifolia]|nr:hypothetical protein FB451DRAFT_1173414 [Mycena latifolia]
MSTHTRPDSAMATFTKPARMYMACMNCRAGKVKVDILCCPPRDDIDLLISVYPRETASLARVAPRRGSNPPSPSGPTPHVPAGWTQAPPGYGASGRGSHPQPSQDFFPPQTASQFTPGPGVPAPMTQPNRYPPQPQHFAGGDYIPYNYGGTATQPPPTQPPPPQLAHPSSRLPYQQPGFATASLAVHATVVRPEDERLQMSQRGLEQI